MVLGKRLRDHGLRLQANESLGEQTQMLNAKPEFIKTQGVSETKIG